MPSLYSDTTFECTLAAHGVISAPLNAISAIRERPGGSTRQAIPPRFLRHADEQTVVGLAAVLRAMESASLGDTCYDNWGVVAAPRFPGRLGVATTFRKYQQGGSATIRPHVIPQNSLHSLSSSISIGLSMHGPNFGVNGGPEAFAEGLTVAMTLLDPNVLPGLWLVLTQWVPEPVPDGRGSTQTETACMAVALALLPGVGQQAQGKTLRLTTAATQGETIRVLKELDGAPKRADADTAIHDRDLPLVELARWLTGDLAGRPVKWSYGLPWGGRVELLETSDLQLSKAA